ncbi:hypothetical protein [Soonwooa sp.]|uniref:hypothetical protein n=1 Tax=Soonwooa sp. TaxID=1938592 RepID=UPI00260647C5|nr:hypothetical protein [Soonwooa sp.]
MRKKKEENENITADYTINGIDYKTEIRLGLTLGIILLTLMGIAFFLMSRQERIPNLNIGIFVGLVMAITVIYLKISMKFIKCKVWEVHVADEHISFNYGNKITTFPLADITMIKNLGNSTVFRYLSFITKNESVKMRVGDGDLTPFSGKDDVAKIDELIQKLMPYIDKNFNIKGEKKIMLTQFSFKNMGVYVNKNEKIHYNLIEKMGFAYYAVGMFICLFLFVAGMAFSLEIFTYYSDHDKFPEELIFDKFFYILTALFCLYCFAVYIKVRNFKD